MSQSTCTFANSLRQIADWYDAHPQATPPSDSRIGVYSAPDTVESAVAHARMLSPCRKIHGETVLVLERQFGVVTLQFVFTRKSVCTARVVGHEEIPECLTPAYTREIIEWECSPLLAADTP